MRFSKGAPQKSRVFWLVRSVVSVVVCCKLLLQNIVSASCFAAAIADAAAAFAASAAVLSGHTVSCLLEDPGFGAGDNSTDHGTGGSVEPGCLEV